MRKPIVKLMCMFLQAVTLNHHCALQCTLQNISEHFFPFPLTHSARRQAQRLAGRIH